MTKILVVDDDRVLRALLQFKLAAQGHDVRLAETGVEALALVASDRPDLIVMDCMMPGMDGEEALRHLKTNELTQSIPVIMLTARRGDDDAFQLLKLGAADFVSKPFNPDELVLRIRRFVDAGELQPADNSSRRVS
ncbi:MAG: response regulator [Hyphomonas sp.]